MESVTPSPALSPKRLNMQSGLELLGWILLCQAVGGLGALATIDGVKTWYTTIQKPSWTPPNWVFGPVWTLLYVLMAVAAWRVALKRATHNVAPALWMFLLQLALNCAWSFLFFGAHRIGLSFAEILLMLAAILLTMVRVAKVDRIAMFLLVPYLAWVTYASTLNGGTWWLNRG